MVSLNIDNHKVEVETGSSILDAARKLGIDIPTLCHVPGCTAATSCLTCVVKVNGNGRLVPSCATTAVEGMVVESETAEVHAARRTALELLLSDHAGDCLGPCQNTCPAHMDIPTMIRQIQSGDFREALITVKRDIALPAVLGRICPELCEKGCHRAARDTAVSICQLKRFVADWDIRSAAPYLPPRSGDSGKGVAIVGAGPAGLAAAYYLQQFGHQCTLFDDHPQPGGALRYGVGEDRLPGDILDAEIEVIRRLGARFQVAVQVGGQASLQELSRDFDAVLLAIGPIDPWRAGKLSLAMHGHGLQIDRHTLLTSLPGVFAAGACINPYRFAIRAVADGKTAAHVIHQFLMGHSFVVPAHPFSSRLHVLNSAELACLTETGVDVGRTASSPQGLTEQQARQEASRCLSCDCAKLHDCRLRNAAVAYHANPSRYRGQRREHQRITSHPYVLYQPGKCIACGLCVPVCSYGAMEIKK